MFKTITTQPNLAKGILHSKALGTLPIAKIFIQIWKLIKIWVCIVFNWEVKVIRASHHLELLFQMHQLNCKPTSNEWEWGQVFSNCRLPKEIHFRLFKKEVDKCSLISKVCTRFKCNKINSCQLLMRKASTLQYLEVAIHWHRVWHNCTNHWTWPNSIYYWHQINTHNLTETAKLVSW